MSQTTQLALSVRQPWAWLIIRPDLQSASDRAQALARGEIKTYENRDWQGCPGWRKVRGRIFIHASSGMTQAEYDACQFYITSFTDIVLPPPRSLDRGGIIGEVTIMDCISQSDDPWFCGPYGLLLKFAAPLDFRRCKGALGFFPPQF